jgi:hypothetical protein
VACQKRHFVSSSTLRVRGAHAIGPHAQDARREEKGRGGPAAARRNPGEAGGRTKAEIYRTQDAR